MNRTVKAYSITRLKSKDVKAAIIQKIIEDFNLTPILAEAYFPQISSYFVPLCGIRFKDRASLI